MSSDRFRSTVTADLGTNTHPSRYCSASSVNAAVCLGFRAERLSSEAAKFRSSDTARLFRLALGEPMLAALRRARSDVTLIIRSILASRGLSLAEIARQSRIRFSWSPLFHISPNFYDVLRRSSFSPSFRQVHAPWTCQLRSNHSGDRAAKAFLDRHRASSGSPFEGSIFRNLR